MPHPISLRDYLRQRAAWVWNEQGHAFDHGLTLQEETLTEMLLLRMARDHAKHGLAVTMFNKTEEGINGADWEWIIRTRSCELGLRVQAKRLFHHGKSQDYGGLDPKSDQADKLITKAGPNIPLYVFFNHDHGLNSNLLHGGGEHPYRGRSYWGCAIACAKAGVTTGEWGEVLRATFGEYRAPTGVSASARNISAADLDAVRQSVDALSAKLGRRLKFLVGKPGLDGHSNGAEQIAVRARDCGMEVVYEGIRLTPAQIVNAALEEGVHVVGLSILSGSHKPLVLEVMDRMRAEGLDDVPVVIGGIIPAEDEALLKKAGVAAVYTPKDFQITNIMADIVALVAARASAAA